MKYRSLIALQTILRKEITRFLRIWTQTLLPSAMTMTLYFIIFGRQIGSQIPAIHGVSYIQYIAPGLVMMTIITNAWANTAASFFGAKFSHSVEEMLVSSMPGYVMLLGYMLGGALRGILTGIIVTLIALCFTHFHIQHPVVVIAMAVLASMVFALGGFINALFAKKFDDVSYIPTFVLTPLTYLGGVFYSIQKLPPFWQKLTLANPIYCIVSTFRYGMLGISGISASSGFFLVTSLFLILFVWCIILLNRGTGLRS